MQPIDTLCIFQYILVYLGCKEKYHMEGFKSSQEKQSTEETGKPEETAEKEKSREGKEEKIAELKKMADDWIKIAQSSINAHYTIYGTRWLENTEQKIEGMGAEAPKMLVENFRVQKSIVENSRKLIEELSKIKDRLESGSIKKAVHEDLSIEEKMIELINTLH